MIVFNRKQEQMIAFTSNGDEIAQRSRGEHKKKQI